MEKNTILAIVLSSLVLIVSFVIQGVFFTPARQPAVTQPVSGPHITAAETSAAEFTPQTTTAQPLAQPTSPQTSPQASPQASPQVGNELQRGDFSASREESSLIIQEHVVIDTELMTVVLTNAGGDMVSWRLKDHFDRRDNVDMIFAGSNEPRAFSIAFGDLDAVPVSELFHINRVTDYIVLFYRDFIFNSSGIEERFRLTKRYEFKPNDYMFELTITLDGGVSKHNFNFSGNAYTLSFGPQIGPRFEKLDNNHEYRHYFTFANGKRRNAKVNDLIETTPSWAAISGKYFSFIAIPYIRGQFNLIFTERPEPGIASASRLNILRSAVNNFRVDDVYRFYLGPKSLDALSGYNTGRNDFGIRDAQLSELASSRGVLAPLERVLKWLLIMFHRIVPNYGIAIILLTLLIKIVFFPLTKKGSEATLRMQALAPKIKEIQEKYKGNPQKLQAEMGNFYKQEGYNPISGCLPLLLQLPIFIAMYNLFNNHFDLRGAMFIPGWIPDLSSPEYIWQFPGDSQLPLLGWTALRLLPFIYVGSQLLYGKVTQMPGQQSNNQMKMMMYIMPIIFFFVLYNMPSGLLIYWIFSNLLTLVQQLIINKYVIAKRAAQAANEPRPPVIAPNKGGGKSKKRK